VPPPSGPTIRTDGSIVIKNIPTVSTPVAELNLHDEPWVHHKGITTAETLGKGVARREYRTGLAGLERDGDRVRLITRGGYNWTDSYPWIIESARCGAHLPSSPSGLVIIPDDLGAVRTRADADQSSRASVSRRSVRLAYSTLF
jgi:hypothetical protein